MMRSLYAGVAGLKTHQTKMDVIGNNIANVNTIAYKSSSITFSELMYQTTQGASGPNAETGRGGVNARQIGLGVQTGAITTKIATPGASQNTGNPFDMKITGDAFFVVSDGVNNFFTRDGSFYVDAVGNLAMSSNGYNVMGWGVDETGNAIKQDTVSALRILNENNMTYPPEATSKAYVSGIIDKNDTNVNSESGKIVNLKIFDNLGYEYTAKFSIHAANIEGEYYMQLDDLVNADGESVVDSYNVNDLSEIVSFGKESTMTSTEIRDLIADVSYKQGTTPTNGTYHKAMGNSEFFTDFDQKKISGLDYVNAGNPGDPIQKDVAVALTGTGTVSKDDIEVKGAVFQKEVVASVGPPPVVASPARYYLSNGDFLTSAAPTTTADWATFLKIDPTALATLPTINPDGSVDITVTQNFNPKADATFENASTYSGEITKEEAYGLDESDPNIDYALSVAPDGKAVVTISEKINGYKLKFDTDTGKFISVGDTDAIDVPLEFKDNLTSKTGELITLGNFSDVDIDFSTVSRFDNQGASTVSATNGDFDLVGTGRKLGALSGVSVINNGMIYASYDNGESRLLGQIAVAEFANASGLEKAGDNLYSSTMNSGDFNGIGQDITASGGMLATGVLEMSNVDLSAEFTEMITTQRGFQANSRIITTSDSMLEELVNLKR